MAEKYLVVTDKGRKLIRRKFGIPYGLFLAIYANWFEKRPLITLFITGYIIGTVGTLAHSFLPII